jgi:hypothetical protein
MLPDLAKVDVSKSERSKYNEDAMPGLGSPAFWELRYTKFR